MDDREEAELLVAIHPGVIVEEVIDRYLTRIEYANDWGVRLVLRITDRPVLMADPERAFGQPIFLNGGHASPTRGTGSSPGSPAAASAEDYGVPLDDVRDALAAPSAAAAA